MSRSKRKTPAAAEAGPSTPWKKFGLDVDALECPICTEPFSPPVFQCDNGHTACSNCCKKLNAKGCPSCSLPIGRIRCLAIEKVMESLLVECQFGCATALRFCDREEHERNLCEYRPFKCPMPDCIHTGPMCAISEHFSEEHQIPTRQWCESTRSASFDMGDSDEIGDSEDTAVLVKAKEAWLLVNLFGGRRGHRFTIDPVWTSNQVVFKLSVKAFPHLHNRVYIMESSLLAGDHEQYLFVPGQANSFDVTLSLIG